MVVVSRLGVARAIPCVFALVVLAGVVPLSCGDWLLHDQQRVVQLVGLCGIGALLSLRSDSLAMTLPKSAYWAISLFFVLGLASAAGADQPRFAFLEVATFWLLGMSAWALGQTWRREARAVERMGLVLLAAVGGVVALKILIGYAASIAESVRLDTLILFEGTFSNRRFFGQVATLIIPLMAWAVCANRRHAAAWFALLTVWWMMLFVSGTRGSWVALAAAHGLALLWAGKDAWRWTRLQANAALAGLAAYWLLFYAVPGWIGMAAGVESRLDNLGTLSAREVIWGLAWDHALAHPWLGIGPMHFAATPNPVAAHPHNAVLQLAAEWGFPAMLAAVWVAAWGLWAFVRPLRVEREPLRLALAVSLLGAAVQSVVDGVIVIPYTQTWLALVAGLALGVHFHARALPAPGKGTVRMVRGATLLALAGLLYGVTPAAFNRAEATRVFLETHDSLTPRFWAQGWIR